MDTIDVLWAAWEGRGFEHLALSTEPGAVRADSLIIAVDDGHPYRARYVVECDAGWKVTRARVEVLEQPARVLAVRADGRGRWTDAATGAVLALEGCVDIDIYPSPFTNTLPIRRLTDVVVGRPVAMDVAWVLLPDLTIQSTRQEYTLLERGVAGARWRFRSPGSDFVAELDVDHNGVVLDYPGIARRVL